MKWEQLLVFTVKGVDLALPLNFVREVVAASQITVVPDAPPFLLGLAAVRGQILAVIDAAKRFKLTHGKGKQFLVCKVRENLTAIVIDAAVIAGNLPIEDLSPEEEAALRVQSNIPEKFLGRGYSLHEIAESDVAGPATGRKILFINCDLFVSDEMASRIEEVA